MNPTNIIPFLVIILAGLFLTGGFQANHYTNPSNLVSTQSTQSLQVVPVIPQSDTQKKSLQLYTFGYITPSPSQIPPSQTPQTPLQSCTIDSAKKGNCTCTRSETDGVLCDNLTGGSCPDDGMPCNIITPLLATQYGCSPSGNTCIYLKPSLLIQQFYANGRYHNINAYAYAKYSADPACSNRQMCFGKPVIYLYPEEKLSHISVKLNIPGEVVESIPSYPQNGWQDITAYPDGRLEYQGATYNELYYESSVNQHLVPQTGFVIPKDQLADKLDLLTQKMGLVQHEREEFLAYWLPRLQTIDAPRIFVSFLTPEQKETVDKVTVNPQPQTTIAFLAYFKGVTLGTTVPPFQFPSIPQRKGFTMVEWGGTIDQ